MQELKIADYPCQKFSLVLMNKRCTFQLDYNEREDRWYFNLAIDEKVMLQGRKLIEGVNLLKGFGFDLGILAVVDFEDKGNLPNRRNLVNGKVRLYHVNPVNPLG